jgi:ABC-type transport system involved in multi-copper enzyme maturation permease subunit
MPISERGYAHWQGTFIDGRFPWWPITRLGIRLAFKRKYFKFVYFFSLLPALAYLAGVYISERLEDFQFMFRGSRQILKVDPQYFKTYFTSDFLLFMMVIIMVLSGAGLIADDLKFNSLQLYFSRPLRKRDYLLGKMFTIFFFLMLLTFIPGLLFIIVKLIFSGSFKFIGEYPWIPFSVIGYSLLVTVFFAFYTLLLSSLGKNRRYVSILIFLVYIFSDIFFGIFYGIFRSPYFALLSIKSNLQQMGAFLFRVQPPFEVPWVYSLAILAAICAASGFALKKKIKGVEVIK